MFFETDVFVGGVDSSPHYRIPGLIATPDGSLLAFAEARPSPRDPGEPDEPIGMVVKRSVDSGRTWGAEYSILADDRYDFSDPRPLIDEHSGTVYLFCTRWADDRAQNQDTVEPGEPEHALLFCTSTDNGQSWSDPVNILESVRDATWRSVNCGPGNGIQLRWQTAAQGNHNGRLIFPAIVRNGDRELVVAMVYSDDYGDSWQTGPCLSRVGANESEIVELTDGRLLLSCRNDGNSDLARHHFVSEDGGASWYEIPLGGIVIPRVDAALIRGSAKRVGDDQDRLLFCGPLGEPARSGEGRQNLGVWTSYDEGATFVNPVQLAEGHSGYSAMYPLGDGSIGILYEAEGSTLLRFLNFDVDYLEKR